MAHIDLPAGLAGPRGPMTLRPETAGPLSELAEVLLRGPSTLTKGGARVDRHLCFLRKRLSLLPDDPWSSGRSLSWMETKSWCVR